MEELLFPCYRQLLTGIRRRRPDPQRKLHIQVDADGSAASVADHCRQRCLEWV